MKCQDRRRAQVLGDEAAGEDACEWCLVPFVTPDIKFVWPTIWRLQRQRTRLVGKRIATP